jgi:hypothetical protein
MFKQKGFHLGKRPVKLDWRNIRFKNILKTPLPTPPNEYDVSNFSIPIPHKMFGNDQWGDCVIAGRANQTLAYEAFEQDEIIDISDSEVLEEYWAEQGATKIFGVTICRPDGGLYMLDSMNAWRRGWQAGGRTYNIYAHASLTRSNRTEIKLGIYLLNGLQAGILLPNSAIQQFDSGQVWDVVGDNSVAGGHCVFIRGYNETGPICETWAKTQQMTWAFWDKYTDECYGAVDNRDDWVEDSPVDVEKLDGYLKALGLI